MLMLRFFFAKAAREHGTQLLIGIGGSLAARFFHGAKGNYV